GVILDQADVADNRALLERDRRALDLQVLDDGDSVACDQYVAIAVAHHHGLAGRGITRGPLETTVGAYPLRSVDVGVFQAALRTGGRGGHDRDSGNKKAIVTSGLHTADAPPAPPA